MAVPAAAGLWQLQADVELGAGGYGRVVQATNTQTGKIAAAKVISTSRMKVASIKKEIQLMTTLKHENIIEFLGFEENTERKRITIYMELAANGELFSRVISAGCLDEEQARPYFTQIMSAVQYMHSVDVAHRDLKLENVLLDAGDNCKICDFGLAHVYDKGSYPKLREICGSKSYCAPEVLEGRGYDGFPADVWSCGICLFAMLAGFFPLDEASGSDWRYERVKMAAAQGCSAAHTIFAFYERPCLLSVECTDLIDAMMTVDPEQRLKVEHALGSAWISGKLKPNYRGAVPASEGVDAEPVYRGGAGLSQEALAAMFQAESNAEPRPVYRGGPPPAHDALPPLLGKQAAFNRQDDLEAPA